VGGLANPRVMREAISRGMSVLPVPAPTGSRGSRRSPRPPSTCAFVDYFSDLPTPALFEQRLAIRRMLAILVEYEIKQTPARSAHALGYGLHFESARADRSAFGRVAHDARGWRRDGRIG